MPRACYTDAALVVAILGDCTRVRSAAPLNTVQGQHRGKKRLCNIGPTAMDGGGMLKNNWIKVRIAVLLITVQGQHGGKEGRCNIGPTATDGGGGLKNNWTKVRIAALLPAV